MREKRCSQNTSELTSRILTAKQESATPKSKIFGIRTFARIARLMIYKTKEGAKMTEEERCYYVETLEQIKFRCEEKGYSGEVEALDVAIELMEEAEVDG